MLTGGSSVLVVGCGAMGGALACAWSGGGVKVAVLDVDAGRRQWAVQQGLAVFENLEAVDFSAFEGIVLAVKPQQMEGVLATLGGFDLGGCWIVSVAAGVLHAGFASLGRGGIRAMPNLGVGEGEGMTSLYGGDVAAAGKTWALDLFGSCGQALWLEDEALMDAACAIAGSGPAYVFYFLECLYDAGLAVGLDAAQSFALSKQTMVGAMALLAHGEKSAKSKEDVTRLRLAVTSAGGTTAAALAILGDEKAGLRNLLRRSVKAADARGRELAHKAN